LILKETFRAHPGDIPIEITFVGQERKLGILSIDENWGVDQGKELETKISKLQAVKAIIWE
jgi:hypothetical protein